TCVSAGATDCQARRGRFIRRSLRGATGAADLRRSSLCGLRHPFASRGGRVTLLTYAVDLDQLRSTCGSGDLNLLDEARRRFPHRFEPETGSPDDGQEETGRASSERALTSLLTGEQSAVWGDDLAAALMVVCEILG